jgi:malonate transporter MadL subunit
MVIYGVATLSVSLLTGLALGDLLGKALGVKANVGGVGIAMLMLILIAGRTGRTFSPGPITAQGITFWSAMYIPIVVAMAARQNVVTAMSGGPLALAAGVLAVAGGFAMIPLLARAARRTPAPAPEQPS